MDAFSFLQSIQGLNQADQPPRFKLAVVDPAYSAGTYPTTVAEPRVTFEGESVLSTKRYPVVKGYLPAAGDRVAMAPIGGTYLILGAVKTTGANIGHGNPPRAKVWYDTTGPVANDAGLGGTVFNWGAAWTTVETHEGVTYDDTNPLWSRFTIRQTGLYDVDAAIAYDANGTGVRITRLLVNGTQTAVDVAPTPPALLASYTRIRVPMMAFTVGDYIEVSYAQNSGGSLNVIAGRGYTYMAVRWVAAS